MKPSLIRNVTFAVLLTACAGSTLRADDTTSADKTFITNAQEGSLAEINYAKLALQERAKTRT